MRRDCGSVIVGTGGPVRRLCWSGPLRSQTEMRCVKDVLRGTPTRGNGGSGGIGAESLQTEMKF